jgi:methylmalonyl-CoA mutase
MDEKLFHEFPPIPTQAWEEVILKDLKGADYEKRLIWKTLEGFSLKPYYRSENLENLDYLNSNPGNFPYTRGVDYQGLKFIRQDIRVKDVNLANKQALSLLNAGVSSLGFIITEDLNKEDFNKLMNGINPEAAEINFLTCDLTAKYVEILADYAKENSFDINKIQGSNKFDPLAYMVLMGKTYCGKDSCNCVEEMYNKNKNILPQFSLLSVEANAYHNAGANAVQELAFALSQAAEYLKIFAEKGISVDEIAPSIRFNFAVGSNYFMEIAKLRAVRFLWAKIVEANSCKNLENAKINMHCETSQWNKTIYDPHVNMLRVTTEAMSAIIGGTNTLSVVPFDFAYAEPSDFSLRIAKNVQLVITEEAHFDKVSDPAAGSYYIENLTDMLIDKTWDLFLKVDEIGGYIQAVKQGFIQDSINEIAEKRSSNIANRLETLLGTNQFPNFNENKKEIPISEKPNIEGEMFKTITLHRGAVEFEKLRLKTDKAAKRPVVFMLTIGNLAFRKARAQFSSNFFACAGFEVIDNNGFENIEQGIKAAKTKNADIIVLCSSDEEYETLAVETFEKIDSEILVIAGNPACKTDLEAKGIKNFIHVRSNVLEELKSYQKQLGIN